MKYTRLLLTCFSCLAFIFPVNSTNDSIDNLLLKLSNSKSLEKTIILNQLANYYQDSDPDKSASYLVQAINYAKSVNDSAGMADALYYLGNNQMLKGNNNEAYKNLTNAYHFYILFKNKIGIARSSDNLGSLFRYYGSFDKSLEYHLRSLAMFKELNDTNGIISATNNLGIIYRNLRNIKKSISYYHESLSLAQKTNSKFLSTVFNSIGSFYWYQESFDSALYYYRNALKIIPHTFMLKERHCAALNNIGNVYRRIQNPDSAIFYYKLSLKASSQYGIINLSSITLKNFGIVYHQLGKTNEALRYFAESISLAKKSKLKQVVRDNYLEMSHIYSEQRDYKKALEYHQDYSSIQDSIFNEEQTTRIAQLEVDYVLQQKEKDHAILSKNIAEQKLEILKAVNLSTTLILIITFLILMSFIIYRLFRVSKKSAKNLLELNEELERRVKERTYTLENEIGNHKLTAIALLEAKEKAEESDRLKSAFLANLSHEIRTPMNSILGFAELLKDTDLTNENRDSFISIIQNRGYHLLSIITDIIEISKIATGQIVCHYSPVNINSFIDDLHNSLVVTIPKDKDIELRVFKSNLKNNIFITTDEVKLCQVMTNLITNAIKFTKKGFVTFGYELVNNKEVKFTVQDTGIGINKKYHQIIFDRFRQVEGDMAIEQGGSGLGLAISKAYVEMLGGIIELESEIEKGSKFTFTIKLPDVEKSITETKPEKPEEKITTEGNKLILVAEDDDTNFIYIKELFSKTNYQVIRACNGREAVDICTNNKIVRLVLMDIKMPEMDGYDALKIIKQIKPNLPVIAQTAYALADDGKRINEAGFDGYITKPIISKKLFELIKSLI